MTENDFKRFAVMITGLVDVQNWTPWSASGLKLIFSRMSKWTFEEVQTAYLDYAENPKEGEKSQFRPDLGQIIGRLPKYSADISPNERAGLAWDQIALDLPYGRFTGRAKIDEVSKKIISSMGGMDCLSRIPDGSNGSDDRLQWKRKQFLEAYVVAYDVTEARANQAARLEQQNAQIEQGKALPGGGESWSQKNIL